MASTIGLFKTEVIKPRRPRETLSHVKLATAGWVPNYYRANTKPQLTATN
ncbi:hypothetical protein [Streptomyces cyaneofuscatus]